MKADKPNPSNKLNSNQKIALMAAVNAGGELSRECNYGVRESLVFLGLVRKEPAVTAEEMARRVTEAWKDIRAAVRAKDASKLEMALRVIRDEKYLRERIVWRITDKGFELLQSGTVTVWLSQSKPRLVRKTEAA